MMISSLSLAQQASPAPVLIDVVLGGESGIDRAHHIRELLAPPRSWIRQN
jgi:hypothetical protein